MGLALALLLAIAAAAAHAAPVPQGVFRGTLGKSPIVACFDGVNGSYYYESRRRGIRLVDDDGVLQERTPPADSTGSWRIASAADALEATWTSPDGKRVLPVRLHRLAALGTEEVCEDNAAFNAPRLAAAQLGPVVAKAEGGVRVQRAKALDADVERLQLDLPGPAGARINAELAAEFRKGLAAAYSCNDYSSWTTIEFVDPRWIVLIQGSDYYCGGAHPDASRHSLVFTRADGHRVDTSKWLRAGEPGEPDAALWRLLARKAGPDEDCSEAWDGTVADLDVRPSPKGITVDPEFAHVIQACEAEVELSLDEAAPFLAPEAKQALAPKR